MRINKLKPTEIYRKGNFFGQRIKRSKDTECRYCKGAILKGEEALRVEMHQGSLVKRMGVSHINCFI